MVRFSVRLLVAIVQHLFLQHHQMVQLGRSRQRQFLKTGRLFAPSSYCRRLIQPLGKELLFVVGRDRFLFLLH